MAAYRFFDNPKAGFAAVLKPHRDATVARMAACQVVLVPQDTTTADDKAVCLGPKGLGTIKDVRKHPRRLHLSIAFTPQRVCLGVLRAVHWARDAPCPRAERRHRGVDGKESRHWVGHHLPEMAVNAVLAREESPPPGAEALEWLLLTGLPVASYQPASLVVAWYAVRWCIEVYFHVLKSGCQLKRLHLETDARRLPCLALYMVVAWRVLFALMLGRGCPDARGEIAFDPKEWKAAYTVVKRCQPPAVPPPLGEVVAWVASLGGYLGRKHDGPPGPKARWIGLQRLRDFVIAIDALQSLGERCV